MGVITLPIPITYAGKKHVNVDIDRVCVNAIAEAKSALEEGDSYRSLQAFVFNCVKSVGEITDASEIRNIIGNAPYKTVEYLITSILTLGDEDDGIEGIYKCPRCTKEKVCAVMPSGDDTRDHIRDLDVIVTESNVMPAFNFDVSVEIKNAQEGDPTHIDSITIEHPTINQCSAAYAKYGDKDTVRISLAIYLEAMLTVNGAEATRKWKTRYGMQFMKDIGMPMLKRINEEAARYGLKTETEKTCRFCGKVFPVTLNTSSFFVSALSGRYRSQHRRARYVFMAYGRFEVY